MVLHRGPLCNENETYLKGRVRRTNRTMFRACWIWCCGSAGGGVMDCERLRCLRRFPRRAPFVAEEVPTISTSESSDRSADSNLKGMKYS